MYENFHPLISLKLRPKFFIESRPPQHPLRPGGHLHPGRPPRDGARRDDGQDEAGLPQPRTLHQRGEFVL